MIDANFWQGRRVLVTGHTGFKGGWLTLWLDGLGADVHGLALAPPNGPNLFDAARIDARCASNLADLRDASTVAAIVRATRPEVVFHLAAQPLVRASYRDPVDTWATNVTGTIHLLEALRVADGVRAIVVVTSDKCYEHAESGRAFREGDPLGGHDPYSASKGAAEIAVASWARSFFDPARVGIATARAGNVIGGGDWADDRLIPDLVRGAVEHRSVPIRYPNAVRPWQHVVDPLRGYLMLAEALFRDPRSHGGAWNFGPDAERSMRVGDVSARFASALDRDVRWHVAADASLHEAAALVLDSGKAQERLGWRPRFSTDEAIRMAADGYRVSIDGGDLRACLLGQLALPHRSVVAETVA